MISISNKINSIYYKGGSFSLLILMKKKKKKRKRIRDSMRMLSKT